MWAFLKGLLTPRSIPADRRPLDELGDAGLSDDAKAEIDRLRQARGWGVSRTGMTNCHLRPVARQWCARTGGK